MGRSQRTLAWRDTLGKLYDFNGITKNVRDTTIRTFADDESASVQARICSPSILLPSHLRVCAVFRSQLCKTGELVLKENPQMVDITYKLLNKQYIPMNLAEYNSPRKLQRSFFPSKRQGEIWNLASSLMGYGTSLAYSKATITRDRSASKPRANPVHSPHSCGPNQPWHM